MTFDPDSVGLGRVSHPDTRDAAYSMRRVLSAMPPTAPPAYRYWTPGKILNQGSLPHCVGFGWSQWLQTSPVRTKSGPDGHAIYASCKAIDGLPPGVDGSYVRAGVEVMRAAGRVANYVWAFSLAELREWILLRGPVVVGTNWPRAMFYPDEKGVVRPGGVAADAGHAYLIRGYSSARKQFRCVNSWGAGWGQKGQFWVGEDDLWALIQQTGEACAAVEQPLP